MEKNNSKSTPIFFWELKNNIISIVLVSILMIFLITTIMYQVVDDNIINILDRNIVIARNEYNRFYQESIDSFSILNRNPVINDLATLQQIISSSSNYDFWLIIANRKITAGSGTDHSSFAKKLMQIAALAHEQRKPIVCSELSNLIELNQFSSTLGQKYLPFKAAVEQNSEKTPILFQVVAYPLFNQAQQNTQIVVVGKILNNDNTIVNNINQLIPGTNSTISVRNGLRISGNIKSASHDSYIGKLQEKEHIEAVYSGKRYYGQIVLEDLNDKIISEPIINSNGEIIGALTTGFPYLKFSEMKINITLSIILIALISFLVAVITNLVLSQKGSRPLIHLSSLAKEISLAEKVTDTHINNLKTVKAAEITEIRGLQRSFVKMSSALFEKNIENEAVLTELSSERNKLHELSSQLHKANIELEQRVKDRTGELHKAVIELTELNKMKTKFLANMSHEIRTPLNSIIGFSDVLYDESFGPLNVKQKEYIKIILQSAEHLLELINDILDMSIIDQGKMIPHMQFEKPNQLIYSVMNVLQSQAERKKITTTLNLNDTIPAILLDPVRIKQVMYNIVNNAIKFTPPGGSIVITSDYHSDSIIITVQDSGIGIAEDVQNKIFDEFFQAENIHKKLFDGVGLGLPLSKKLIEMHKGNIKLISQVDVGTTVIVTIPAKTIE